MTDTTKYTTEAIRKLIVERPSMRDRGGSLASEVGVVLEDVPTEDLIRFYVDVVMRGNSYCIRDYVEQSIIAWLINKEKYEMHDSQNQKEKIL